MNIAITIVTNQCGKWEDVVDLKSIPILKSIVLNHNKE